MTEELATNKISRIFVWITWLLILATLGFGFNEFLEDKYNPNQKPQSYQENDINVVILERSGYGHYVTAGKINQKPVTFMLDTGATNVSIPEQVANNLNLEKMRSYYVQTANGRAKVYQTQLSQLSIGDILLYNVDAHINPNMNSDEILLGMSALKQVEFSQKGKYLTLIQTNN